MKQKQKLDKTDGVRRKRYEGDDTHQMHEKNVKHKGS